MSKFYYNALIASLFVYIRVLQGRTDSSYAASPLPRHSRRITITKKVKQGVAL